MDYSALKMRFEMALSMIKEASEYLLSHEALGHEYINKAHNDYVTIADKECESFIDSKIKEAFPDDAIFGEESGYIGSSKARWIIDPIDGTVNFMNGFPFYSISIAFEDEDGLAFGLVSVVRQHELFTAMRGEGAYLNGKRIFTDEKSNPNRQLAIMVPPHRHHEHMDRFLKGMVGLYDIFTDMRSLGSAAASLCYVACGRCGIYYEFGLALYDCAAGIVILKEAGGRSTLMTTDERWIEMVGSSSSVHDAAMEKVI